PGSAGRDFGKNESKTPQAGIIQVAKRTTASEGASYPSPARLLFLFLETHPIVAEDHKRCLPHLRNPLHRLRVASALRSHRPPALAATRFGPSSQAPDCRYKTSNCCATVNRWSGGGVTRASREAVWADTKRGDALSA